jgi:hypothetical protein
MHAASERKKKALKGMGVLEVGARLLGLNEKLGPRHGALA